MVASILIKIVFCEMNNVAKRIYKCYITFNKNKTDDYHCCVQWQESGLTCYTDNDVPTFKRYHHISKEKIRKIFRSLRQIDFPYEISVSNRKYGKSERVVIRYMYTVE